MTKKYPDCCPLSCPPRHGWEVISSRPLPSPESLNIGGVKEDWLTVGDLVEVKHGLDLVTLGLEPRLK